MSAAVVQAGAGVHPLIAGILANVQEQPEQLRRAEYVSRLRRMDWEFEHAARIQRNKGAAELKELQDLQAELDPQAELWNRHAKFPYLITRSVKVSADMPDGGHVCDLIKTNRHSIDICQAFAEKYGLAPNTKIDVTPILSPTASDIERGRVA